MSLCECCREALGIEDDHLARQIPVEGMVPPEFERVAAYGEYRDELREMVDEIYMTGATARERARVLRRAGAERVWVATLARAQTEMVALWGGN